MSYYLKIHYKLDKEKKFTSNYKIRIFGKNFVNKNKGKCNIIYNNKEYKLKEFLIITNYNYYQEDIIKIKLKVSNKIDLSEMFCDCEQLLWLSEDKEEMYQDYEKIDESVDSSPNSFKEEFNSINDYTNQDNEELLSVSNSIDIYKENFDTITTVKYFSTKYNTYTHLIEQDFLNMKSMFKSCKSLISFPNISEWNYSNIIDISNMFYECKSLISLPDMSKWDTSNVTDMSYLFYKCESLISLPNISKWDTSNVTNMSYLFYKCESLISLPNISTLPWILT